MFGIFKKKVPTYPTESLWTVYKGKYNGNPIFFRRNDSAPMLSGHPEYRFRMGIAVPLNNPNQEGLPSNDEMEQLNIIEDSLTNHLEADQVSLEVLAITTGGMREFIFYTRNPKTAITLLETLQKEISSHELQHYVEDDPNWDLYKEFA